MNINDGLQEVLDWWTHLHTGCLFDYRKLPITSQEHSPNGSDHEPSKYNFTNNKQLYSEHISKTPPASPQLEKNETMFKLHCQSEMH